MTARQIALFATVLLQADDIEESIKASAANASPDDLDPDARTLIKCMDLALSEIRNDGFPIIYTVERKSVNGTIEMPELENALTVLKVELDGKPTRFEVGDSQIFVGVDGTYKVSYSRRHSGISSIDASVMLGTFVTRETVAYLTARNYCLITGRTDEASVWDQLYSAEALKRRIARRARLPRRAWR